jgi:hypothetical protein
MLSVKCRLLGSLRAEPGRNQEKHYRGEKKRAELLCLLSKHSVFFLRSEIYNRLIQALKH